MQAGVSEIFSSIQGEGKYVGCRQLFIRLIGCNMDCPYCDTDKLAHSNLVPCILEKCEGYEGDLELKNPLDLNDIMPYINYRLQQPHHSISITGGEPLLYPQIILELAKNLKPLSIPLFLETNGTLVKQLAQVIDEIDIISMDMKLPSDIGKAYWQEHEEFLKLASKKDVYVKIVVSNESTVEDFEKALSIIKNIDENILLVLQPITPLGGLHEAPPEKMLKWQTRAMQVLKNVRVIPQTHKMMNQL